MKIQWLRCLPVFCLSIFFFVMSPSSQIAQAAGIVVNSSEDSIIANGYCSLREAINNANTDSDTTGGDCAIGSGTDTISFEADYTITLDGSQLPPVTTPIIIAGNGASKTIIQANSDSDVATWRVFEVGTDGYLKLTGMTVRNGHCSGGCNTYHSDGGGFLNMGTLDLTNCTVEENSSSSYGGGIYNRQGDVIITNSWIENNSSGLGGGILNWGVLSIYSSSFSENEASYGGGIYSTNSTLFITGSTFTQNSAENPGGGIYIFGGLNNRVHNSTISGNLSTQTGGGIHLETGSATITNCTLSGNSAIYGGGIFNNFGNMTLNNSIVANSISENDCESFSDDFTSNFWNLIETNSNSYPCAWSINDGQDPLLGPLSDNGGLTLTHALLEGSPAINMGSPTDYPATDQRGVSRPQGTYSDIGAYELAYTLVVTVNQAADQPDPTNSSPIRFIAVFGDPIQNSTFEKSDITLGGTAPGILTASVLEIFPNNGTTFEISISGMSGSGAVTAAIAAGRVFDTDGNTNLASTGDDFEVNYDITPPLKPIISTPVDGSMTHNTEPTISGTAEPNSIVTVYLNNSISGTTGADGSGNWSYTPAIPLNYNQYELKATATDAVGNTSSESDIITFNVEPFRLHLPLMIKG